MKEIEQKIIELGEWYQNFNLDGVLTNPTTPNYPESRWEVIKHYIPEDLTGKTVLDLGCNAGYFSVKMKQRGASYVLGIDLTPWYINQAKFIANYYKVDIDFRQVDIYDFMVENKQKFDYVIFLGLFYHLKHPLFVLDKIPEIVKEKMYFQTVIIDKAREGRLILEDNYMESEKEIFNHIDYPKMVFIEKKFNNDSSNWWFVNEPCVYAVLRSAGFANVIKTSKEVFICGVS